MSNRFPVIFLWCFFSGIANASAQDLLPGYMHVVLVKGQAARKLSLRNELARLDSLQVKAMDALHDAYPWFTYEVADSPLQMSSATPAINLCYEVITDQQAPVRNILMGISSDAFLYIIRRKTLDARDQKLLSHSAEMMKDLHGYLQPGPLLSALYKDIYKKLAADISTYVFDTKTLQPPQLLTHPGISIDYQGITGPATLSAHEKFLISGIVNNILVAGQSHYVFGFIPGWRSLRTDPAATPDSRTNPAITPDNRTDPAATPDSLIDMRLTATDSAGVITLHLDFSARFPLLYEKPVDRDPAKMGGELIRTFTIPAKELASGNYDPLVFPMGRSISKFLLLNIPPLLTP